MKNIRFFIICSLLSICLSASAQYAKPRIIAMPSASWCHNNGYMQKIELKGQETEVPDYKRALLEDEKLNFMLSKMSDVFVDLKYPLQDLKLTIEQVEAALQNDGKNVQDSKNIESLNENLFSIADIDIVIELDWNVQTNRHRKNIAYNIRAIDIYTGKLIGTVANSTWESLGDPYENFYHDEITSKLGIALQRYFEELMSNGREISISVMIAENEMNIGFETEFEGESLSGIIDGWLEKNAKQTSFYKDEIAENHTRYDNVFIPTHKENRTMNKAEDFIKGLMQYLCNEPYNIPCKTIHSSPGRGILVIGEK